MSSTREQPPLLADPVRHLCGLLDAAPQRRHTLGLVGFPGSGKSTLAAALAAAVNRHCGDSVMVALGMDGFHLTRAQLRAFPDPAAALARRGAPWTFDPAGLAERLRLLRRAPLTQGAAPMYWPGFEHGMGDPVPDVLEIAPSARIVMLEGLYLLHDADGWDLRGLLDSCWFLDVPLEMAMDRLAARHLATRGITQAEAAARIAGNDRLNAHTVLRSRGRADALVPDTAGCGLPVAD